MIKNRVMKNMLMSWVLFLQAQQTTSNSSRYTENNTKNK